MMLVPDPLPAVPFKTTELLNHRVLVLAPHPDDETLGCGGSLILHARHRDPVKVVFLTNGVRGDVKRQYRPDEYVARRGQEARQACQGVLGVTDLEFWEYEDGALAADASTLTRLRRLILVYQPTLVYVPSPQEFHHDHRVAAFMLYAVVRGLPLELLIAFYEFNRPIHVNTLVDISGVVEEKRRACGMYATQLANYPYTDCALGLNRYRALTVSPACQYAEGYVVVPSRALRDLSPDAFSKAWWPPRPAVTSPLVSIIVRTADRPALLADALASLVAQTCSNLEVIVVNDGGQDVSHVLAGFDSLLTIRHIHHDKPRGRAGAANSGLAAARGTYINFLDDDDRLYPDHVAKLVGYLEKTGELVAYSDCEQGRYQWVGDEWQLMGERTPFMGIDYDWDRLHLGNYIPMMAVMFRRSLLERVDPMDESLEFLEDWDFWLRLAACTPFQRLPGITAEYRLFTGSKYSARQWHMAVLQKHRGYWCVENMYDLGSRLGALIAKNAELEHALACADSQRRQAEAHVLDVEAQKSQAETRLIEVEAQRRQAEGRLLEVEGRQREAEARWQRAEAVIALVERSIPMRLSRLVQRYLPQSAAGLIRAWSTRKS
jgi:LmbE family N-acetylglucosaminyl deacetylase